MNYLRDVIRRLRAGQGERQVARDLRISRGTVHKDREMAEKQGWLDGGRDMPDDAEITAALGPKPVPPRVPSSVEPYAEMVHNLLAHKVEMMAIWQRLRDTYGYQGSYSSVRRFVNGVRSDVREVFVRVNTAPGEEMQVDFGYVGQLFDPVAGKPRNAYVFVATLSYSRHQYAELVFDQKMVTWIALHRRAFESFGGVPRRVVTDNLKAAVEKVLIIDPILSEAYRQMATHYGFLVSPTRPRTPRHKGKVESGVGYVKRNFMAGQQFADIRTANQHLKVWVQETAGTRNHGTTHQAPLHLFHTIEKQTLLPLPETAFTLLEVKPVTVHDDGHVLRLAGLQDAGVAVPA